MPFASLCGRSLRLTRFLIFPILRNTPSAITSSTPATSTNVRRRSIVTRISVCHSEPCSQPLRQALSQFTPQQPCGCARLLLHCRRQLDQLSNILFHVTRRCRVQFNILVEKRRIASEVDPHMPVLLVRTIVKQRPVSRDPYQAQLPCPSVVESALARLYLPERPPNLEFVCIVFMEKLKRILNGLLWIDSALAIPIYPLKRGRLAPAHGPDRR